MATKKKAAPLVEADFSRGIVTDLARTAMPQGTVRDSQDYLLFEPGRARKRGGTVFFGPGVSASVPSFHDESASNHEIIPHGGASIDTGTKKFGDASALFNSAGDFLSLDGSSDFIFGTGDFTIDFWLNVNNRPPAGAFARLIDFRPSGTGVTAKDLFTDDVQHSMGATYQPAWTVTPSPNKLYLLSICLPGASASVSGVTGGGGLTWVKVGEKTQGNFNVSVWRAMKPSGLSSGQITISLTNPPSGNGTQIELAEFDGVDTTGTDGSGAIVQTVTNGTSSATSLTVTLATFASTANVAFGALYSSANDDINQTSGFTRLHRLHAGSEASASIYMWKVGQGNPKASFASSKTWAGVAIELAAKKYPLLSIDSAGLVKFSGALGDLISTAITSSAQHHIALARSGTSMRLFIDGTQVSGSPMTDGSYYDVGANRPAIGGSGATEGVENLDGHIDEIRISNSARWTANFTPAVAEYSTDGNTMLLMHTNVFLADIGALRSTAFADFPTGARVFAVGDDSHLYWVNASDAIDLGSLGASRSIPKCKPVLHLANTSRLIFPANDGTSVPFAYDGTTLAILGGTPPAGQICTVFKARLLLANSKANPNRLWFSPLDLASTWDTANAWVDFDHPITGLVSIRNTLMIFSPGHVEYLTGSIPPGTPGFDMVRGPLGDTGCVDGRSIDNWHDQAVFANPQGVYLTNGAAFRSLTEPPELGNAGIGGYWRSLTAAAGPNGQYHGGVLGDFYVITIRDDTDTLLDTLMCYLPRRAWMRLKNFDASMFASAIGTELYYAPRDTPRLIRVSPILSPDSTNQLDANGTPVEPLLETRFIGTGPQEKAYGFGRLTYEMAAQGGGVLPTMAVSLAKDPIASSFSAVPESPLLDTGATAKRKRFTINKDAQGVTLRFVQSGASAETEILALEVEEVPYQAVVDA